MITNRVVKACLFLLALGLFARTTYGQGKTAPQMPRMQAAPVTNATVDGNEAMFTTMCALYASGFEGDVSADHWSTFRAQIRERTRQQTGPALEAVRAFYQQHELQDPSETLSRYVWFGLLAGAAPNFKLAMRREELPPEVLGIDGFGEVLAAYYKEQKIGSLWRQVQPVYNREIERLHDGVAQIVLVSGTYLRDVPDPGTGREFQIIVEPLVGRITNVRNFGDRYAIVLSGSEEIPTDVVRHAYLHFLLDPLPLMYPHVTAVKRALFEEAAKAPRLAPDLKDDFPSWFAECLVRAVELKLKKLSPSEREAALNEADADGYVLERPIYTQLAAYEKSEPSMKNYFPDLIRAIDAKTEMARVVEIRFAPRRSESTAKLNSEEVSRKRSAAVKTLPNDQTAIDALTEGEKQIAAKNQRAAETSFKSVLEKYPDQPRAWYGLGLVALMDHDGPRAVEIFGRLTKGEHAATGDPMVMAWSHVYLGRILADQGQPDRAKAEFEAAIEVQGAPAQAQAQAQKGLGDLGGNKPAERP